jgi:Fe-S-cluster containining protein
MASSPRFWKEGIRFECQGTGRCCVSRGAFGFVYLTLADRQRLARHFKLKTLAFTRRHCDKTDGHFHLKKFKGPCPYLEGKACSVYEARPAQCRTWPFWPENMSARAWSAEVKRFCPGIGKGRLYTEAEILAILAEEAREPS